MRYRELAPPASLAHVVNCVWSLSSDGVEGERYERIIPDGRPELIVSRADPMTCRVSSGRIETQPSLMLAGQLDAPLYVAPSGRADLLGIRFTPAGAFAVCGGLAMSEIRARQVPLTDVCRSFSAEIEAASRGRGDPLPRLLDVVGRRAGSAGRTLAGEAVAILELLPSREGVATVARRLGVGLRTLQRSMRDEVGVSPKTYSALVRFRRAASLLRRDPPPDGATIAQRCGYFDQSHFIRDFRRFAGGPPGSHRSSSHAMTDHFVEVEDRPAW